MKRFIIWTLWLSLLLILSTGSVLAQGETYTSEQDALWSMLAPIIAIATMTERVLEIWWGRYEKDTVWPNTNGVTNTKEKEYVFHKQQCSQWLGTAFAFIVVGLTNARFFRILGLDVLFSNVTIFSNPEIGGILDNFTIGTILDWVLTAGIIGWGGTELVHNIIEALIKGRSLWKETQQVRTGEKHLMDTQIFYDYILPQMEKMGLSAETFYQITGWLQALNIPFDKMISAAATNTLDTFFAELETTEEGLKVSQALHNLMERENITPEMLIQIPNMFALINDDIRERLIQC